MIEPEVQVLLSCSFVVGRIYFLLTIWTKSLLSSWLSTGGHPHALEATCCALLPGFLLLAVCSFKVSWAVFLALSLSLTWMAHPGRSGPQGNHPFDELRNSWVGALLTFAKSFCKSIIWDCYFIIFIIFTFKGRELDIRTWVSEEVNYILEFCLLQTLINDLEYQQCFGDNCYLLVTFLAL